MRAALNLLSGADVFHKPMLRARELVGVFGRKPQHTVDTPNRLRSGNWINDNLKGVEGPFKREAVTQAN